MFYSRKNHQRRTIPFADIESWEEHYGDFILYVERHTGDSGRYRTSFSEKAYVCKAGDSARLYEVESSSTSGHLLRQGETGGPTNPLDARDQALQWLTEYWPGASAALAQAAEEEARLAAAAQAAEAEKQVQARAAALQRIRDIGPFQFLAERKTGYLDTPGVAKMLGMATRDLNKFMQAEGYVNREGGKWVTTKKEYFHRASDAQIFWNAVGIQAIWNLAREKGLVEGDDAVLQEKMFVQVPWLGEWKLIADAAPNMRTTAVST